MKLVIVGAGAIGSLLGAFLSRGGHEVIFVEPRREVAEAVNQQGIGLMELGEEDPHRVVQVEARAVASGAEIADCDGVLLTVKAFDTRAAVQDVGHLLTRESPLVTLQTALGHLEVLGKIERRPNILAGLTYMTGVGLGPARVRHSGTGPTYLGELGGGASPRAKRLSKALNECGLPTEVVPDITDRLWRKVLIYSAVNPVSTVLRVPNGRLLEKMEAITLMKRLIDEGREVAEARGIELGRDNLYDLLFDTCRHTTHNISSMLQDVISGRPTEIEALNGTLYRYGRQHGLAMTTHQTMIELIKVLEKWGFEYQG